MPSDINVRVVALLAVRNEIRYLERCLCHLRAQGVESWVIDNSSNDGSLDLVRSFLGNGVLGVENYPYPGFFDWRGLLKRKAEVAQSLEADWFIHHDADEIRETVPPWSSLLEGLAAVDAEGYNAVSFDEFVFLPTGDDESYEGIDYVEFMRYYYFFRPADRHRVNAWKKQPQGVDLASSGGHEVMFSGRRLYPRNFVLRHYVALSRKHLISKYSSRSYSKEEVEVLGWHRGRAYFSASSVFLPSAQCLKRLGAHGFDRSEPWRSHPFLPQEPSMSLT